MMGHRFLSLSALFLGLMPAYAQPVATIEILEVGLYEATTVAGGQPVNVVRNPRLLRETTSVPAQLGTRFGLRYRLQISSRTSPVGLTFITRSPVEFFGSSVEEFSKYSVAVKVGLLSYREFQFDHLSELIPGVWTFEFWLSGQKLGEQKFCVFELGSEVEGCDELNS